jgi:hypothetical protein
MNVLLIGFGISLVLLGACITVLGVGFDKAIKSPISAEDLEKNRAYLRQSSVDKTAEIQRLGQMIAFYQDQLNKAKVHKIDGKYCKCVILEGQ